MEKTTNELKNELDELKQKYNALEIRYNEEVNINKKNTEDLEMKLMFLEAVANSVIDGFLVVSPYGQKILQNQRTIDLWKIPDEVVKDTSGLKQVSHVMYMTVNPKQFVDEINYLRDHPNDHSRDELELIDGTVLDRYSSPVIGADGVNYGRIWTFHDMTEQKNLEKTLLQLNADKDRFISILAHDLKSPFNSLLGFLSLLKSKLDVFPPEKIKKLIDMVYDTTKQTYELLEDTLLWASVQSKRILFNPERLNLSVIAGEVTETLVQNAKAKNITISNNIDNQLFGFADSFMLKAILRNLLSNAIKFTHQGGNIQIFALNSDNQITIKVTDNGVGVQPDVIDKLFKFTAIRSAKGTANETGTGFGLLLCKEFIEKHGGKIWLESVVNQGTSVFFTIPVKLQSA